MGIINRRAVPDESEIPTPDAPIEVSWGGEAPAGLADQANRFLAEHGELANEAIAIVHAVSGGSLLS